MSIMAMIKSALSGQPQQTQQPGTPGAGNPGQIPTNATVNSTVPGTNAAPNGIVPTGASEAPERTPLDTFSEIWKTDPNAKDPNAPFSFNVDPNKLMEAAGKIDFAKVVGPETLAKIAAGGTDAAAAFADALNKVTQQSFAQSALASSKMVEQAVAQTRSQMESQIPGMIKKQSLSDSLRDDNPAFNHPAASPVIAALETSLQTKYPNATVTELRDMAKNYFVALGDAFVPKTPTAAEINKSNKEVNWEQFLQ